MRLAISGPLTDEVLAFGAQIGATDYVGDPPDFSQERGHYGFQELMIARNRVEDAGLKWTVAGIPEEWTHRIKLGLPGRDEQLTSWCRSIEHLGAAGVPVLHYCFALRSSIGHYGLRTSRSTPGRGGAKVTSFDHDQIRPATQDFWDPPVDRSLEVTDRQVWDNLTWFLERVVPVAEDAGVKLALHPDDPPVSPIGGVARVVRDHAALKRVVDMVPSAANGLTFCVGTIAEMPGDVFDAIRDFGTRGKIHFVHFRNVTGTVPTFAETFVDEGYVDMVQAMRAFREFGFDGPMVEDHVPQMTAGPEQWPAKAFALGYMRAVMQAAGAD